MFPHTNCILSHLGVSRLTSTANGILINRVAAGIAATAVAAYSVQSNVTYLTNAVVMGIAQTFMILISMYYGEQNRKALERVTSVACRFELLFIFTAVAILTKHFQMAGVLQVLRQRIYSCSSLFWHML